MLALGPHDWTVMVAVLRQAVELRKERDVALVDALSQATATRTISALSRAFKR